MSTLLSVQDDIQRTELNALQLETQCDSGYHVTIEDRQMLTDNAETADAETAAVPNTVIVNPGTV